MPIEDFTYMHKPYNGDPSADRDKFIGGSDAGTILGVNPYKSAYTLWLEKTGQIEAPDISDNEPVWWGNYDEEGVAKRFSMKSGIKVRKSNKTFYLKEYPFIAAHVDRIVVGDHAGLECKTTSAWNKTQYDTGDIPAAHYAQCQHYMLCYGAKHWYYAVKRDNREFYYLDIPRDEAYIKTMLDAEISFWNCVQNKTAPDIDGSKSTTESLGKQYAGGDDTPLTIDPGIKGLLVSAQKNEEIMNMYKELRDEDLNKVKGWMGEHTYATGEGFRINWKAPKPSMTLDSKALKKDMPEVYEKYAKPKAATRRFTFKEVTDND